MPRKYRRYDYEFKKQICERILAGELGINEAARQHGLNPALISKWKSSFEAGRMRKDGPSARERELEKENEKLKAKVGELVMLNDLLKKISTNSRLTRNDSSSIVTKKSLGRSDEDVK